jgi:outer membrane protein insertion porin family
MDLGYLKRILFHETGSAGEEYKDGIVRLSFRYLTALAAVLALVLITTAVLFAQSEYEGRRIERIDIAFEGADRNLSVAEQYRLIVRDELGPAYSTVKVRDAIEKLYRTDRIVSIAVEAAPSGAEGVILKFLVKRKTQASKVTIVVGNTVGEPVTEEELLLKLNLLTSGYPVSEQILRNNADVILDYLRERGYFNAEVKYTQTPVGNETDAAVNFLVTPNTQAHVESFTLNIEGFDAAKIAPDLDLKAGDPYTRERLNKDVERVREALRKEDFLAPELNEPRAVYEREKNSMNIELTGKVGPKVSVSVETEREKVGSRTQNKLIPLKREGTLDYAAIVEGERRLENYYQEHGYFFADVTPVCSVDPPLREGQASAIKNDTEFVCSALGGQDLMDHKVEVKYRVDLKRQLRLVEMRLQGTDEFTIDEIQTALASQEANGFGFIPFFGYGRGYTSEKLLAEDAGTIRSLMRELGYRDATVRVTQGVSPTGDDLIITFIVEEGVRTIVREVDVVGSKEFSKDILLAQVNSLVGQYYSQARVRNSVRKLQEFYSQQGYYDASVTRSIVERTDETATAGRKTIKVQFNIINEGKKVFVDRVLITGNEDTKPSAVRRALTIQPGEVLRATDIYTSEQNLYQSDVFSRVEIKPQPAGERPDGNRLSDVIVSLEEQPPRLITYGGGFSTDLGLSGFFDIRHFNLLGRLYQGGARVRWSQRQQLAQLDFQNPRFLRDGKDRFAPLTFTAQYQRDSTVTRFFRSAFDKGTFGIVQRVDVDGNPIDTFGLPAGDPTLNRLTLLAETSRTISRKKRSILFFRYRFEDVRLYNIGSLLIKDLLLPDAKTRISGFGATFVRDTRENCNIKYTILDIIAKGEAGPPCRYSTSDPTRGSYLTAEYNVSLPFLGANVGFHKFQASFNTFYTLKALNNTTFAARAILGMATVFSQSQSFNNVQFPDLDGILPISERFFAGGSNTLRGFDFESAGPRVVIVPQGTFINSDGNQVFLDPFTVPFGGNGLAVVNLEARIPLTKSIRAVPFYDGGNVFRRASDIFNPPDAPPNDVARQNLRALWTNTIGLGLRIKTPVGGEFGVDYGYLLNPPRFLIPQGMNPNAIYQLKREHIHFRFSQAF